MMSAASSARGTVTTEVGAGHEAVAADDAADPCRRRFLAVTVAVAVAVATVAPVEVAGTAAGHRNASSAEADVVGVPMGAVACSCSGAVPLLVMGAFELGRGLTSSPECMRACLATLLETWDW